MYFFFRSTRFRRTQRRGVRRGSRRNGRGEGHRDVQHVRTPSGAVLRESVHRVPAEKQDIGPEQTGPHCGDVQPPTPR